MRRGAGLLEIRRLGWRRQRARWVKRNRWYELENVLCDRPRPARLSDLTQGFRCGHDSMDSRIEIHWLLRSFCTRGRSCAGRATAIPDAPKLISRNDLGKKTGRDVSHFDEA